MTILLRLDEHVNACVDTYTRRNRPVGERSTEASSSGRMAKGKIQEPDLRVLVGRRVRQARNEAELTQAKLAEYAELSSETISRLERGFYSASVATLLAIADALDVTLDSLVGRGVSKPDSSTSRRIAQRVERLDAAGQTTVLKIAELIDGYAAQAKKPTRARASKSKR